VAIVAFKDAYSPGALSTAHARGNFSISPEIAVKANSSSCTTCHSVKATLNQNCAACHTTAAFHSEVSDKHIKSGLTCVACHSEHHGRDFRPALVANVACVGCHHDGSGYVSPISGKELKTPHGGTFGYPARDGVWVPSDGRTGWDGISQPAWERKRLPGLTSQFSRKEQFHLIHLAGRQQGRTNCSDCHTAGFEGAALTQGVGESCAGCHGNDSAISAEQNRNARSFFSDKGQSQIASVLAQGPLCVSCHAQHGEEKESAASLRRIGK
jgi:hypothetical protein